jgi:hypothetical protein
MIKYDVKINSPRASLVVDSLLTLPLHKSKRGRGKHLCIICGQLFFVGKSLRKVAFLMCCVTI